MTGRLARLTSVALAGLFCRLAPAADFTVNSELDGIGTELGDGIVTLRDAFADICTNDAPEASRIVFDAAVKRISLTNSLVYSASVPLVIDGAGGVAIVSTNGCRHLDLSGAGQLALSNLTFVGSRAAAATDFVTGGGFSLSNSVVLAAFNCAFRNMAAARGGAFELIGADGEGCPTGRVVNCSFEDDRAAPGGAGGAVWIGGGRFAAAGCVFSQCGFAGTNAVDFSSGSVDGGAIAGTNGTLLVVDSSFSRCSAGSGAGGALWLDGNLSAAVAGCAFDGNSATAGADIRDVSGTGIATIVHTTLREWPGPDEGLNTNLTCAATGTEVFASWITQSVAGVEHRVPRPAYETSSLARMDDGAYVRHDADWDSVSYASSASSAFVALCGDAAAAVIPYATNLLGSAIEPPFRGAFGAEGWCRDYLCVTTNADLSAVTDGRVPLRMALKVAAEGIVAKNGGIGYRISFSRDVTNLVLSESVAIVSNAVPYVIAGGGVTFSASGCRHFDLVGADLTLLDANFRGGDAGSAADGSSDGGSLRVTGGEFLAENCSFASGCAYSGGGAYFTNALARFVHCSFTDLAARAADGGGAITLASGRLIAAGCSFARCGTTATGTAATEVGAGAVFARDAKVSILETSVAGCSSGNTAGGAIVSVRSSGNVAGCAFDANDGGGVTCDVTCRESSLSAGDTTLRADNGLTKDTTVKTLAASQPIFRDAAGAFPFTVSGAIHASMRPVTDSGAKLSGGISIWHDNGWDNVSFATSLTGIRTAALGDDALATDLFATDIAGRTVADHWRGCISFPASWTTLTVDRSDDVLLTDDGTLSLRGAIELAASGAIPANDGDAYRITISSSVTAIGLESELAVTLPNLTIAAASGATLSPVSSAHCRIISFSGTRLAVSNLTFSGGCPATGDGGAILLSSYSSFLAENCSFRGNGAEGGGAISLAGDAGANTAAVVNCSFVGNRMTAGGGAVWLGPAAEHLLVMGCSFVDNGWGGDSAGGAPGGAMLVEGRATVLASSFFGSSSGSDPSGAIAWKGSAGGTVAGCAFDGNLGAGVARDITQSDAASAPVDLLFTTYRVCECAAPGTTEGSHAVAAGGDIFRASGMLETGKVYGVTHVSPCPDIGNDGAEMYSGYYFRHDAGWTSVSGGASRSGGQTAFLGSAGLATIEWNRDLLGSSVSIAFRGCRTRDLSWAGKLEVNTGDDGVGIGDGKVTLRSALLGIRNGWAEPNDGSSYLITIDPSVTECTLSESLQIDSGMPPVTVSAEAGATVTASGFRHFRHRGECLTLHNLTLQGGRADAAAEDPYCGGAVYAGGPLRAKNCRFLGNAAITGGALITTAGTNILLNCSFQNDYTLPDASDARLGGAVCHVGGVLVCVNCAFRDCGFDSFNAISEATGTGGGALCATNGTVYFLSGECARCDSGTGSGGALLSAGNARIVVAGCAFDGNTSTVLGSSQASDLDCKGGDAKLEVTHTTLRAASGCTVVGDSMTVLGSAEIFDGGIHGNDTVTVDGVSHVSYRPSLDDLIVSGMGCGISVWHDADWRNVAYAPGRTRDFTVAIGNELLATSRCSSDLAGAEIVAPMRGCRTAEIPWAGNLAVDTEDDFFSYSTNAVSLREALISAYCGWAVSDDIGAVTYAITLNGDVRTIRLSSALNVARGTPPINIASSSGTTLVAAPSCRHISHEGALLSVKNLTFTNGAPASAGSGGAVYAAGSFRAENCAFVGNCADDGGAVWFGTGTNALVNCTFLENHTAAGASSCRGGAVFLGGGSLVCVNGSFVRCGAAEGKSCGAAVCAAGGTLRVVSSSFVGCTSGTDQSGALLCSGADVWVAGGAFDGNTGSSGARDVTATGGKVKLWNTTLRAVSGTMTCKDVSTVPSGTAIFAESFESNLVTAVDGVNHVSYAPNVGEALPAMTGGALVWHDAAWSCASVWVSGLEERETLLGDASKAKVAVDSDIVGRLLVLPCRGCRTTSWGSSLEVNEPTDTLELRDGQVSLRAALVTALSGVVSANDGENYVITFADSLFEKSHAVTVSFTNDLPMTVSGRRVVVRGRGDNAHRVTLAVKGGTVPVLSTTADSHFELNDLGVAFETALESDGGTTPSKGVFLEANGSFAFRRCSFTGTGTKNGHLVSAADQTVPDTCGWIEQCSFTGARCGALHLVGNQRYVVINSTFAGVEAPNLHGVLQLEGGGALDSLVVSCTFVNNTSAYSAMYLPKPLRTGTVSNRVANCLFAANKKADETIGNYAQDFYDAGARADYSHTAYSSAFVADGNKFLYPVSIAGQTEGNVFSRSLRSVFAAGTERFYRPVRRSSLADRSGAFVFHDAAWSNAFVCLSANTSKKERVMLCGTNPNSAKTLLNEDVAGRTVWTSPYLWNQSSGYTKVPDLRATAGSFATEMDAETSGEAGVCEVNGLGDDSLDESNPDSFDGITSLREAIAYATTHPGWRDADGNCTVRFSEAVFGDATDVTIPLAMRQIQVSTNFTGCSLTVEGVTNGTSRVILDGSALHRIFYVAPENRVTFSHLTFTNAIAEIAGSAGNTSGGAILNAGFAEVRDCAFVGCRTPDGGAACGGALANAAGATALVTRCSFVGCSAMHGGALANAENGGLTVYASSFAGNAAEGTTGGSAPSGGAVYAPAGAARTSLVNCTLVGNSAFSGGGLWAGGSSENITVQLLNSVIVGNTAEGTGRDVCTGGKVRVRSCCLGDCNDRAQDDDFDVKSVAFGLSPTNLFAFCTESGAAVPQSVTTGGVRHVDFPLLEGLAYPKQFVKTLSDWSGLYYASTASARGEALWGTLAYRNYATRRTDDLFGTLANSDSAYLGSSARVGAPAAPEPEPVFDPLCVTNATSDALQACIDYAAAHPELAEDGAVTVTFSEEGFVIPLAAEIQVASFANSVALRIKGPVAFRSSPSCRLFHVLEGNSLQLEGVELSNCYDVEKGGAVFVESGSLKATDCTFSSCATGDAGFGGAVALWRARDGNGTLPSAVFERCSFASCSSAGGDGDCVYQEDITCSVFRDCTFGGSKTLDVTGNDVIDPPRAAVRKSSGITCYFGTVARALEDCVSGDTLVRLDDDSWDPEEGDLPPGVSFVDESSVPLSSSALSAVLAGVKRSLASSGIDYYAEPSVGTDASGNAAVVLALSEAAAPDLAGEGASVDLAGSSDTVTVMPANVKPDLWYGLGRAEEPSGPYEVTEWRQADSNGTLSEPLTAPKCGGSGFYRVIASPQIPVDSE